MWKTSTVASLVCAGTEYVASRSGRFITLLLLLSGIVARPGAAMAYGGIPFDSCGDVVPGVLCPLFRADDGRLLILPSGSWQAGARLRIIGSYDPFCVSVCGQGVGCLQVITTIGCGVGTSVCLGVWGAESCPCGNQGPLATISGCANSESPATRLTVTAGQDSLTFRATGLPIGALGVLVRADGATMPGTGLPFGDGVLCLAGSIARVRSGVASQGTLMIESRWPGSVGTRVYQLVYRDESRAFCSPSRLNATNGVRIDLPTR